MCSQKLRERSLITGREGDYKTGGGGGGASEVLPPRKRRRAILKGATTSFGLVSTWVLNVLTILEGKHKRFPPFKSFTRS